MNSTKEPIELFPREIEGRWAKSCRFHRFNGTAVGSQTVMEYGFRRWGFPRLISEAQPENKASLGIMQKLGMEFDRSFQHDGSEVVCYLKKNPAL